ncbi:MAG: hypothetical protein AVDCRST_MAG11-1972, partial [uncultured Gemmatimonadaceae bacterium]
CRTAPATVRRGRRTSCGARARSRRCAPWAPSS